MLLRETRRWRWLAVAFGIALLALVPLSGGYYTSLAIVIGIHTIIAVGLNLLMGYAGQVSLGHAAFYGLGAYTSGVLTVRFGVSPWLALLAGVCICGGLALLTGVPIFRLRGPYLALATLALGIVVYVVFVEAKELTGGQLGLPGIPPLSVGGFAFDTDLRVFYLVWTVCLAVLWFSHNLVRSRPGRALRAVHGDEEAARSLGVNVDAYKVKVYVLSAIYASIAGSLYAHYVTFVSPQPFGFGFSVKLLTMVAVGGLASVWGGIFGAAAVTLLSAALQRFGDLDVTVFGIVLIVIMIYMPQGLSRGLLDLLAARGRARSRLRAVGERLRRAQSE
jgi:branched-chain amino acid transport system permease protein